MAYKYFSSPIILLLLHPLFQLARAVAPMAKPGCQDHCGNISIPYPFGTTKKIATWMNPLRLFVTKHAVNPPGVFIRKTTMEVRNIEEGAAVVRGPIMSSNCSGRQSGPPVNLEGNPYLGCVSKVTV
ncbi:hypothetical protein OIU78_009355 [Salix suchowensis]|nr:hypothetical protein OIU78_009355 [Salix suchowensis]